MQGAGFSEELKFGSSDTCALCLAVTSVEPWRVWGEVPTPESSRFSPSSRHRRSGSVTWWGSLVSRHLLLHSVFSSARSHLPFLLGSLHLTPILGGASVSQLDSSPLRRNVDASRSLIELPRRECAQDLSPPSLGAQGGQLRWHFHCWNSWRQSLEAPSGPARSLPPPLLSCPALAQEVLCALKILFLSNSSQVLGPVILA